MHIITEPRSETMINNYKLSFCVACMNRLHQIKKTFLKNLSDNEDYENLEFVLLNYNSHDGMHEWVKDNLGQYILSGRVNYYYTDEPNVFSHSHAKNLMFKLAKGDILCNINADHYTGKNFAHFVNLTFLTNPESVMTTIDYFEIKQLYHPASDLFGKVCVRSEDFERVRGFDESMMGYGFEDMDFVNRLELSGIRRVFIEEPSFLNFIKHESNERYSFKHITDTLSDILLQYQSPSATEIIILYSNSRFEFGTLLDHSAVNAEDYRYAYLRGHKFENSLKEKKWQSGTWHKENNNYHFELESTSGSSFCITGYIGEDYLVHMQSEKKFYKLSHPESTNLIVDFSYFYKNRSIMERSLEQKRVQVNDLTYGNANIYHNFSPVPFFV